MKLMNLLGKAKRYGFSGSVRIIVKMALKTILRKRMKNFEEFKKYFKGKIGLEIGGPSEMFSNIGYMPVYKLASVVDGVNFSSNTLWTGSVDSNSGYVIKGKKVGNLYIADATELSTVSDGKYDFVLSCNNIEHIANPMKALQQWIRKINENSRGGGRGGDSACCSEERIQF